MKKALFSLIASILTTVSLLAAPQAVIFDFGGVMTGEANREAVIEFVRTSLKLSQQDFQCANQEKRAAMQHGKSDEEFWIGYAISKGISLPDDWSATFRSVLKKAIGINAEMYALVEELKEQNIPVGMLSNIDDRLAKVMRSFGLYEPFAPCLLSNEIGAAKPDRAAYEILLAKLNLPAHEVIFIDDNPENITAAQNLGIDAILFLSAEQIRNELTKRNIFGGL